MRRLLAALVLVAGPLLYLARRRESGRGRGRVQLYYDDGSMVTVERGPEAQRLLALAHDAL